MQSKFTGTGRNSGCQGLRGGKLFLTDKEFQSCKMQKALDMVGGDGSPEV